MEKKSKYKGYWWTLIIVGVFFTFISSAYVYTVLQSCSHQNWLATLLGIVGGLFFSVLTAFLIKRSDDKRYDKVQRLFVKNLRDYYLTDFRAALNSYAQHYITAFSQYDYKYKIFKNIQNDNQIDVDAVIFNFSVLQFMLDNVEPWEGSPQSRAQWLVNGLKNLCIINHNDCYNYYYRQLCVAANKIVKITELENLKYDYPIFSEEELEYLKQYHDENSYYYYSNRPQDKVQKFDDYNLQSAYHNFTSINEQIVIFNVTLNDNCYFPSLTNEQFKQVSNTLEYYRKIATEGKTAAAAVINEYKNIP